MGSREHPTEPPRGERPGALQHVDVLVVLVAPGGEFEDAPGGAEVGQQPFGGGFCIYPHCMVYTDRTMAKHLVDIDEQALKDAREQLGVDTIKETVNRALRLVGGDQSAAVTERLDALARADLAPREQAWR
jgi:Arc/MetJ family transcription regulator